MPETMGAAEESALLAIFALRKARDEFTHGPTASMDFVRQEILCALRELEMAFVPAKDAKSASRDIER